jgi:hypothetical protein
MRARRAGKRHVRPLNAIVRVTGLNVNVSPAPPESTFVTVLAWILIVLNAMGVFMALMQNVMINFVMPNIFPSAPGQSGVPFPLAPFRAIGLIFLGVVAFLLYAGFALLKRRNWARRTFVVVFGLTIVACVLWVAGFGIALLFGGLPQSAQGPMLGRDRSAFMVMIAMFGVYAVAVCVLCGWLIKRLRSTAIKAEFIRANPVT